MYHTDGEKPKKKKKKVHDDNDEITKFHRGLRLTGVNLTRGPEGKRPWLVYLQSSSCNLDQNVSVRMWPLNKRN